MAQAQQLPASWQELVGQLLEERYRLDAVIAEGGMSVIFKGHHLRLSRDVALKILKPELEDGGRQFLREAENAARLNHPNCITVYDFGTASNGLNYMVMPLLQGEPLSKRVGVPMPASEVARLGIELLRGLEHAHDQGIIHRDLKPENLFLATEADGSQVLKIVDFGIAKLKSPDPEAMNATMSGLMSGTPTYMSPEQALGQETDERTDIYSVGVVFYTLLVGHPPFNEDDAIVVLRMHINGEMPPLPDNIPPEMVRIVTKFIQKERKNRYASAREALLDLEAFLEGDRGLGAPMPQIQGPFGDASIPSVPVGIPLDAFDEEPLLAGQGRKTMLFSLGALAAAGIGAFAMFARPAVDDTAQRPILQAPVVVAAPRPVLDRDDATALLQELNDVRSASKLSYEERQAKRDQLEQAGLVGDLDMRLQLRLDLEQAVGSKTPCSAFRASLEAIRDDGAERWRRELARVQAPRIGAPKHAGKAPDEGCDGLPALLAELKGDRKHEVPPLPTEAVDAEPGGENPPALRGRAKSRRQASRSGATKSSNGRSRKSSSEKSSGAEAAHRKPEQPVAPAVEPAPEPAPVLSVPRLSDGPRRL